MTMRQDEEAAKTSAASTKPSMQQVVLQLIQRRPGQLTAAAITGILATEQCPKPKPRPFRSREDRLRYHDEIDDWRLDKQKVEDELHKSVANALRKLQQKQRILPATHARLAPGVSEVIERKRAAAVIERKRAADVIERKREAAVGAGERKRAADGIERSGVEAVMLDGCDSEIQKAIITALHERPMTMAELVEATDGDLKRGSWRDQFDKLVADGTVCSKAMRWPTTEV